LQDVLAALSAVRAAASSSFLMDRVSVSSWFVPPIHVRDNASGSHGKQYGNATTSASPSPRAEWTVEYDLGGTIWGGARFTIVKGQLFFNGRPCLPVLPAGF